MRSSIAIAPPRSVSATPVFSRPNPPSTLGAKPTEMSARSTVSEPGCPSAAVYDTVTDAPESTTVSTRVDVRIGMPRLRYWRVISFETSTSSLGSARSRNSMTVTSTP